MLADGCEARVRAERPKEEEDLKKLIRAVIDERMNAGQLDDTHLTMQNLNEVIESFSATLRGVYHPRIIYPQLEPPPSTELITRPTAQFAEIKNPELPVTTPIEYPSKNK
jgi:hypothetical protein